MNPAVALMETDSEYRSVSNSDEDVPSTIIKMENSLTNSFNINAIVLFVNQIDYWIATRHCENVKWMQTSIMEYKTSVWESVAHAQGDQFA